MKSLYRLSWRHVLIATWAIRCRIPATIAPAPRLKSTRSEIQSRLFLSDLKAQGVIEDSDVAQIEAEVKRGRGAIAAIC